MSKSDFGIIIFLAAITNFDMFCNSIIADCIEIIISRILDILFIYYIFAIGHYKLFKNSFDCMKIMMIIYYFYINYMFPNLFYMIFQNYLSSFLF